MPAPTIAHSQPTRSPLHHSIPTSALLLFIALLTAGNVWGQRTITGIVTDEQNQPFCATVFADKAQFKDINTQCSLNGTYALFVPPGHEALYFLGESIVEVPLGASDTLNIIYAMPLIQEAPAPVGATPSARAHPVRVSGTVVNGNNDPLRASIRVSGTDTSVQTDKNGHFSLLVPPGGDVLTFSADQYAARELILGDAPAVYVPMTLIRKQRRVGEIGIRSCYNLFRFPLVEWTGPEASR